jgi:hypothetical protein
MNIAIGKSGRSMYFNRKRWSIFAGDDSPKIIYFELAKQFPEHTFYIIGASDFTKCKKEGMDVPENIRDIWAEMKAEIPKWNEDKRYTYQRLLDYVNKIGLKFDFGIIMQGPDGPSIEGKGIKTVRDPEKDIKPLCMNANYVAPITALLNEQMFPWINLNEDPRYVPTGNKDLFNIEDVILSQINCTIPVKKIKGYFEDAKIINEVPLKYVYAGLEKMFLNDEIYEKIDFTNPDNIKVGEKTYKKKNKFIMTVNGGGNRLKFMEKWIFENEPKQIIYGKWDDESKEKYPENFVEKGIVDLQDEMWETKFTFIPAFSYKSKSFVTQKFWKMLYYGIIPFVDKNGYDIDHLLPIPDFFRVENPDEMWKKIEKLENNSDKYIECLKYFYKMLLDDYFNGKYIKDVFEPWIKKYDK